MMSVWKVNSGKANGIKQRVAISSHFTSSYWKEQFLFWMMEPGTLCTLSDFHGMNSILALPQQVFGRK